MKDGAKLSVSVTHTRLMTFKQTPSLRDLIVFATCLLDAHILCFYRASGGALVPRFTFEIREQSSLQCIVERRNLHQR